MLRPLSKLLEAATSNAALACTLLSPPCVILVLACLGPDTAATTLLPAMFELLYQTRSPRLVRETIVASLVALTDERALGPSLCVRYVLPRLLRRLARPDLPLPGPSGPLAVSPTLSFVARAIVALGRRAGGAAVGALVIPSLLRTLEKVTGLASNPLDAWRRDLVQEEEVAGASSSSSSSSRAVLEEGHAQRGSAGDGGAAAGAGGGGGGSAAMGKGSAGGGVSGSGAGDGSSSAPKSGPKSGSGGGGIGEITKGVASDGGASSDARGGSGDAGSGAGDKGSKGARVSSASAMLAAAARASGGRER